MKKINDGDLDNIINYVTSQKNASEEQKTIFRAIARYDVKAIADVTELVFKKDHKAAQKRMAACYEEYVRRVVPAKGNREKEEGDDFTVVVGNNKQKKKREEEVAPKHAAEGTKGSQLRGNGGNQPKPKSPSTQKKASGEQEPSWNELEPARESRLIWRQTGEDVKELDKELPTKMAKGWTFTHVNEVSKLVQKYAPGGQQVALIVALP